MPKLTRSVVPTLLVIGFAGLTFSLSLVDTTTPEDFVQPGTQPGTLTDGVLSFGACANCHAGYDIETEPNYQWVGSMMAQATRDPIFHACLAIAEQDVAFVGELCIRCHSPGGWLEGRSTPTDGSALAGQDFEGVNCHICHRLVDPVADAGNPAPDAGILAALTQVPTNPHSGQYVIDPEDRRRGPFDLGPSFSHHNWEQSSFHQEALLCANCHDVSNPAYTRVGGATPSPSDTYVLNDVDTQHPTHDKFDEFPLERTYSEWSQSAFAQAPIDMGGRFGGNKLLVSTCQDCHMPDVSGVACAPGNGGTFRNDLPQHSFDGANTWVPLTIPDLDQSLDLYGPGETSGFPDVVFQHAVDRNIDMLGRASDMTLTQEGNSLRVRITNESAHKLPTGYPEGRRMWINVQFRDDQGALIGEHGAYDDTTAVLTTSDTKVYEAKLGIDAAVSVLTGLPQGESFHFAVNNVVLKDNRIPPRGFTNAGFESIQAHPIAYSYADGQHWDDTNFDIPCGAATVTATFYAQTTSKEYIEFLRDENTTNNAGQVAYDLWESHGKSAPVDIDSFTLPLAPYMLAETDSVSLSAGGTQELCIAAGPSNAGKLWVVWGTTSGTDPGFDVGLLHVPLNFDFYTMFSIQNANAPPLVDSVGFLDAAGQGLMTFFLPPGMDPVLAGLTLDHAYFVVNGTVGEAVSNPVTVNLVP